jgi:hypothetical protein
MPKPQTSRDLHKTLITETKDGDESETQPQRLTVNDVSKLTRRGGGMPSQKFYGSPKRKRLRF